MCKIAVIIPYFGRFPEWIDLFLYSCSLNYKISEDIFIDWLIFTDNQLPKKIYLNTKFHQLSFEEYCKKVSNKLSINFTPSTPYKLCDLKPFYGVIHENELKEYSYWGFGDLDLCYGNLEMLLNHKLLNRYDLITTHADRIAGHFTIVKKESKYTKLCLDIHEWKTRLLDEKVLGLDELDLTMLLRPFMKNWLRLYRYLGKPFKLGIYDFMYFPNIIHNLFSKSFIKEFHTSPLPKDSEKWFFNIDNNKILNPFGKEIPYLHFLFFKKTPFWETPNYWKPGFYQIKENFFSGNKISGQIVFDNKAVIYKSN